MDITSHFVKILMDGMKCKVIFAQIVGMDMARWNKQPYPQHLPSIFHQKYTKPKILILVYRPPQGKIDDCLESLRDLLSSVSTGHEIFLLGDLKINYADGNTKAVKELKALEKEYNLKQQIKSSTRETATTETLLNHTYTNFTNIVHKGPIYSHISDHYPVYIIIKTKACYL